MAVVRTSGDIIDSEMTGCIIEEANRYFGNMIRTRSRAIDKRILRCTRRNFQMALDGSASSAKRQMDRLAGTQGKPLIPDSSP